MTETSPSTTCRRCARHLSAKPSIKHGYGPVCYRKRLQGDTRLDEKQMDPCTITTPDLARKVYQAIYRLVRNLDEINISRGKCYCGENIQDLPIESFDHDNGMTLPGFGKPQWFYLHSEKYDLAIWKIHITDNLILSEMKLHGDIPEGWKQP